MSETDDLIARLRGRAAFLRNKGEIKTTDLLEQAARELEKSAHLASEQQEPVYWQWRMKSAPWSTEYIFSSQAHATTPNSEVRQLFAAAPPAAPAPDLIPQDALFVCGQMGAHVTRVRAEQPAPAPVVPLPESHFTPQGCSAADIEAYADAVSAADNAALRELVRDLKAYAYNGNYPNSSTPHFNAVMARVRAALEAKP